MKEQNKCGSQIWKVFSFPVVLASVLSEKEGYFKSDRN